MKDYARLRAAEAQSLNDWQNIRAEVERLWKALRDCAASAGLPDPVEACIGVIMGSKEALGEAGKKEEQER